MLTFLSVKIDAKIMNALITRPAVILTDQALALKVVLHIKILMIYMKLHEDVFLCFRMVTYH